MAELYLTELTQDISHVVFEKLLDQLNDKDKEKILKYKKNKDRERTLIGRLLLKQIFLDRFKYGIQTVKYFDNAKQQLTADELKSIDISKINNLLKNIYYDQYGRPLQNEYPFIDFNISHSGDLVVCGITENGRIGVDIEEEKYIDLNTVRSCFAKEEIDFLEQLSEISKLSYFYHIWTLKEAYIKAVGSTFLISLDSFWFDLTDKKNPIFCIKDGLFKRKWLFYSYRIKKKYRLSVCIEKTDVINNFPIRIDEQKLINNMFSIGCSYNYNEL